MAGWQVERGNCTGNGWTGTGFCKKLKDFMTATYAGGGANWYVWDDRSALGTDPYIVFCDTAAPVVNDHNTGPTGGAPKFIKVTTYSALANNVVFQGYYWWNNTTHTSPTRYWAELSIYTVSGDFSYDFRGGAVGYIIHSYVSGTWYGIGWVDTEMITSNLGCTDNLSAVSAMTGSGSTRTITVASASGFVANCRYMIYDFSASPNIGDMVVVQSISGNDLTVLMCNNNTANFASTAKIGTYPHKWFWFGSDTATGYNNNAYGGSMPYNYYSTGQTAPRAFDSQTGTNNYRVQLVPNALWAYVGAYSLGQFATFQNSSGTFKSAVAPIITPYGQQIGYAANSGLRPFPWFKIKNLLYSHSTTHFAGQDGITVNSSNYLYMGHSLDVVAENYDSTNNRLYWLDTESTS